MRVDYEITCAHCRIPQKFKGILNIGNRFRCYGCDSESITTIYGCVKYVEDVLDVPVFTEQIRSAALDLYSALKATRVALSIHGPCREHDCHNCVAAFKLAVAALKKAEGK